MAQHGYLREGYGMWGNHDEGRDRERERGWRERDEERGFMLEERNRFAERDEDEWFGGRDRDEARMSRYGPEHGYGGFQGDYSGGRRQGGFGGAGDYRRGRSSFSSHPDDHYRSWRQRQIDALDRDYADYCRERELRFHRDFEAWREQRHSNPQPLQTGMTQTGTSDPAGTLELTSPAPIQTPEGPDPTATATLGTTSGGRRRK